MFVHRFCFWLCLFFDGIGTCIVEATDKVFELFLDVLMVVAMSMVRAFTINFIVVSICVFVYGLTLLRWNNHYRLGCHWQLQFLSCTYTFTSQIIQLDDAFLAVHKQNKIDMFLNLPDVMQICYFQQTIA